MRLRSATAEATFGLTSGGRLASLIVDGTEVLLTAHIRPFGWGSFLMVPYAGRIAEGRFTFRGEEIDQPITMAPHAIHGTAWLAPWTQVGDGVLRCELGDPWPFGGTVMQFAELHDDRLSLRIELTAGDRPMPAMVGWHPWFRRVLTGGAEAELRFGASSMYELDDHSIPTGRLVEPPPGPWDNCFTDVTEEPSITWPGTLRLDLSSSCSHWVIYDQMPHALCAEPQSDAPDAFNRDPLVLEPGEVLAEDFTISWGSSAIQA